jgi:hypothetical protein
MVLHDALWIELLDYAAPLAVKYYPARLSLVIQQTTCLGQPFAFFADITKRRRHLTLLARGTEEETSVNRHKRRRFLRFNIDVVFWLVHQRLKWRHSDRARSDRTTISREKLGPVFS